MLRSNLSFKYSLLSKNIIYYLKFGLENVSVSPVRDSYKYVNMKDSVLYSNDYVYHSALKCLFPIINDGHYINFIGIALYFRCYYFIIQKISIILGIRYAV